MPLKISDGVPRNRSCGKIKNLQEDFKIATW